MSSIAVTASVTAVKDTTSSLLSIWQNSVILPTNCDLGIFFQQALRDHLVFRICSKATQKQLLTQFNIALFKVIQLTLSKKAAHKDSQELKSSIPEVFKLFEKNYKRRPAIAVIMPTTSPLLACGKIGQIA